MIFVAENNVTTMMPYISLKDPLERALLENEEESEDELMKYMACKYVHGLGIFEELDRSMTLASPKPSIEEAPKLELKPLSAHLCNAYLGSAETLLLIISSSLNTLQEEKQLRMLREHKRSIG